MTDSSIDDAVWMTVVFDPSAFNTHVAVEVEDADKGNVESEIVDPETFILPAQADTV